MLICSTLSHNRQRPDLNIENLNAFGNKLNTSLRKKLDSALASIQTRTEFLEVAKIPDTANRLIRYWLLSVNIGKSVISMQGWAFIDTTQNNKGDLIFVLLTGDDKMYLVKTRKVQRPDVSGAFGNQYLNDSGFGFTAFTDQLQPGKYQIGIAFKDAQGQFVFQLKLSSNELPLTNYSK